MRNTQHSYFGDVGTAATGASAGAATNDAGRRIYSAILTGTSGALSATVVFEASHDNIHWYATPLGTITLTVSSWSTVADDAYGTFALEANYAFTRARVTAISGTGATVVAALEYA